MELIIVTGMSGAGKSLASKALEDIGYYCVDNMPPALMPPVPCWPRIYPRRTYR